ncbi:MAG: ATP-binding protein [Chloroflexota bacterium]
MSQRSANLAFFLLASVAIWIGGLYYLFLNSATGLPSRPGFLILAPLVTTLLVLYWRGWDHARYVMIVAMTLVVGFILPLPTERFDFIPIAVMVPSAMAMVLAGPSWIVVSGIATLTIIVGRVDAAGYSLGVAHLLAFGITLSCLLLSRLVADTARRESETRAAQANQARLETERWADNVRRHQESLNFQAILLGAVEQPILATDPQGRITYWNRAAEQMTGWSASETIGRQFSEIAPCPLDLPPGAAWWGDRAWAGPSTEESVGHRRDGTPFPTLVSSWPISDGDDTFFGRIAVITDLTERKAAEHQRELLEQGEKLRLLGQMAGGIAHDLNQALGVVSGYAQLALDNERLVPPGSETRAHLETVAQAARQGADSIKRLLTFARQDDHGPAEIVDLGTIIQETVRFTAPQWRDRAQAEGRPIELDMQVAPDLRVQGWATSLREALMNLVLNAVDAMPAGGTIHIAARRAANRITMTVTDTGTGMPPEVQARIFEPFFTTKGSNGTGLGLAMVFGIVERHGGAITVASTEGVQTTFSLEFPAEDRPVTAAPSVRPVQDVRPARILVVDDEPPLVQLLSIALRRDGHQVETAGTGEDALALLETGPVDLIISDLSLGAGINGWQLAEEVQQRWPGIRFVLASGWGDGIGPKEIEQHGIDAVLAKPYRLNEVRTLVGKLTSSA